MTADEQPTPPCGHPSREGMGARKGQDRPYIKRKGVIYIIEALPYGDADRLV